MKICSAIWSGVIGLLAVFGVVGILVGCGPDPAPTPVPAPLPPNPPPEPHHHHPHHSVHHRGDNIANELNLTERLILQRRDHDAPR